MVNRPALTLMMVSLLAGGTACATTQEQVREEKLETIEEHAAMHEDTADGTHEAHVEHAEEVAETRKLEAEYNAEQQKEERFESIEEQEAHATFKADIRNRIAKLGIRLNEAKQKASVKGTPSDGFYESIEQARSDREAIKQDIEGLDKVSEEEWSATKSKFDERLSDLENRVETLNAKVDAV